MRPRRQARFLNGSIMRHIVVMTMSGSLGISFMFLIDMATLFWVSYLGVDRYVAAMGYAFAIQFFTISTGIGFMIAATALVSTSLGRGDFEQARVQTTTAALLSFGCQLGVAALVVVFRREILALAGAEGETLEVAARFLVIAVPSLPFMALGMIGSGVLRAEGDAARAMLTTISAGLIAMVVDPFLIIVLDMGVDGAALGMVISRTASALLSVWFIVRVHDLAGRVDMATLRRVAKPFFAIALPAVATQMASPFGNAVMTRVMAEHGDAAVAGLAVVVRMGVLTFGGVFALSGAIGGILGQNYGAGRMDRVKAAYRDAMLFSLAYTLVAWGLLALTTEWMVALFHLGGDAALVLRAFTHIAAFGYSFTGFVFVANAAFNTLGRPAYSTVSNWLRDGVLMYPACMLFGTFYAAQGVMYGQMAASMIAGVIALIWGWRYVSRLEFQARTRTATPS
jgi:putative MATE family efflux protein